jgi:hypothetical protein
MLCEEDEVKLKKQRMKDEVLCWRGERMWEVK